MNFLALCLAMAVATADANWSNTPGKPLVIIAPPSKNNRYYQDRFEELIRFHTTFARSVLGNDNILVLTDKATRPYFKDLPSDILLEANLEDIWIRDFGTVLQSKPIKFTYQPGYLKARDAQYIDNSFVNFLKNYGVTVSEAKGNQHAINQGLTIPRYKNLVIDGGNVVYNMVDKAVLTSRIYEENKNNPNIQAALKNAIGYEQVAIVTQYGDKNEDTTGHIDGMLSFIDTNTLAITELDEPKRSKLWSELQSAFGSSVKMVEVPNYFNIGDLSGTGFTSACGIHINSLVTTDFIYMPTFGEDPTNTRLGYTTANDDSAYKVISANSHKKVVKIPVAHKVCSLGGSVRCLSMQIEGPIADQLITKARGS